MSPANRPSSASAIPIPVSIRAAPCLPISRAIRRPRSTSRKKLARHFVADEPPPSLVAKLAKTFTDSDGDLKEVAKTLVTADEVLDAAAHQAQAAGRMDRRRASPARLDRRVKRDRHGRARGRISCVLLQAALGEPLWRPPAPNGYPDTEAAWIDGVPRRLDIANEFAGATRSAVDPLASSTAPRPARLGRHAHDGRARRKPPQALALLVMTPEFLRR